MEIKASSFKLRANAPKGQKRFPISNWREPLRPSGGSGLSDYRVLSAVVLAIFAVLYLVFR